MALIQSRSLELPLKTDFKKSTKIDLLLAALNLNLIVENKSARKNARFMDDALKTRGIKYLNIGTWLLFSRLYQNFWFRDWFTIPSQMARKQTFLTPLVRFCAGAVQVPHSARMQGVLVNRRIIATCFARVVWVCSLGGTVIDTLLVQYRAESETSLYFAVIVCNCKRY